MQGHFAGLVNLPVIIMLVALTAAVSCAEADHNREFLEAVQAKNVSQVRALLESPGIDALDEDIIAIATEFVISSGDQELLQMLLDAGLDPDATTQIFGGCVVESVPMIQSAVSYDQPEIVVVLAKAGANLNYRDQDGRTLLHHAAYYGSGTLIKTLAALGLDVNAPVADSFYRGYRPLHIAATNGNTEAITALLDLNADIAAVDDSGFTALHRAVEDGQTATARQLLDAGADINSLAGGSSLLDVAIHANSPEMVRWVLDAGFDVNRRSADGQTELLEACEQWYVPTEEYTTYLDPRRQEAQKVLTDIAQLLLDAGVDVNARDSRGDSVLHMAAAAGPVSRVKLLLAAGASPNARNKEGRTPLHLAALAGYSTYSERTGDQGTEVIIDRSEAAKALLDGGADVNLKDNYGWSVLETAAVQGSPQLFEMLIKAGVDVNAQDNDGNTPLHIALCDSTSELADMLIAAGADPTIRNHLGETPEEYVARLNAEAQDQS